MSSLRRSILSLDKSPSTNVPNKLFRFLTLETRRIRKAGSERSQNETEEDYRMHLVLRPRYYPGALKRAFSFRGLNFEEGRKQFAGSTIYPFE